jgi:hypothetical protein
MKPYYRKRPEYRLKPPSNFFGILAIITGAIGFFFAGIILGVAAIFFGFLGVTRDHSSAFGVLGVILGIIDVAIVALFLSWVL